MGSTLAPPHLLLLNKAVAYDLVHRRFHKRRCNPLLVAKAVPVIRDELLLAAM
jgi:hypothetical protein